MGVAEAMECDVRACLNALQVCFVFFFGSIEYSHNPLFSSFAKTTQSYG